MRDVISIVEGAESMVETKKACAYLYHTTRASKIPSIAEHGLTPNIDRDPSFDGYPVNGRLYVARTEEAASFYDEKLRSQFDAKTAMLRIPATMVRVRRDEFGNMDDYYTNGEVPPDAIEIRNGNNWVPLATVRFIDQDCARVGMAKPDFVFGPLYVFRTGGQLDVTDDGLPVNDEYTNLIVRLVVDGTRLVDAATPRLRQFVGPVLDLLHHFGITSVEGRAKHLFNANGVRYLVGDIESPSLS